MPGSFGLMNSLEVFHPEKVVFEQSNVPNEGQEIRFGKIMFGSIPFTSKICGHVVGKADAPFEVFQFYVRPLASFMNGLNSLNELLTVHKSMYVPVGQEYEQIPILNNDLCIRVKLRQDDTGKFKAKANVVLNEQTLDVGIVDGKPIEILASFGVFVNDERKNFGLYFRILNLVIEEKSGKKKK